MCLVVQGWEGLPLYSCCLKVVLVSVAVESQHSICFVAF